MEIVGNASWGELTANASLQAEIAWCQANRLRCVRETFDRVVVDLSRALSPAPSYAALGWLETSIKTSIKTYAKFVDVASKATSMQDDEQAEVRREQQSIEEVRRLLASILGGVTRFSQCFCWLKVVTSCHQLCLRAAHDSFVMRPGVIHRKSRDMLMAEVRAVDW
jgi:hypothetical protein